MKDLVLDNQSFDALVIDGDLSIADDSSGQNGLMFAATRGSSLLRPTNGVGLSKNLNEKAFEGVSLLNAWKTQVLNDGALSANWTTDPATKKPILICNYGS